MAMIAATGCDRGCLSVVAVVTALQICAGSAAAAQSNDTTPIASGREFSPVTAFAERAYHDAGLPGAALLVYQDGEVVYEQFFGGYDETTQVPIASASKWLSAAVILSLVDEGKLDLDAPVSLYLPAFTGTKGTITVRQMFSHTSGLGELQGEWNYGITIAEYADRMATEGVLKADPGTEVRYGSAGMQVAGRVAEVVSGKSWNELFEERVADPCGMPSTTFARTEANRNPMLAGGAFSTLRDYSHFLEMLINDGVYHGRRVLSEKAVREMQRDQTGAKPLVVASNDRMGRKSHYGLGEWIDQQDEQGRTLQVSSPGAFGFRPWINLPRRLFGVWMVQHPRRLGQQAANTPQPATYDPWALLDLVHQVVDRAPVVQAAASPSAAASPPKEWSAWGADAASTKYSQLAAIDAGNVSRLDVVWQWDSPENARGKADPAVLTTRLEVTPIFAGGVLYTSTTHSDVVALNPATGEELWSFDTGSWRDGRPANVGWVHRGVATWANGDERRILIATGNGRLWSIDTGTGRPDPKFGQEGKVDLRALLRRPATHREWGVSSAPLVCGDVIVVGSTILDRPLQRSAPPGDVQAFDVRTGRPLWTFHNPPAEGEPGFDSWDEGSALEAGGANVWTHMSCDPQLGLVYLPFSTPTNDFYGGHRPGAGLYGESLVAVRASTGERVWHFQTVHHGVWDYDLPTPPVLADLIVDGRPIAALAQISKQGFVWVLDRRTGEPVWPIEERAVPPSIVEGETLSPTQPFPTRPAPFERQGVVLDDVIDWTPELRAEALAILAPYNYGALYTPPLTDRRTINLPGNNGGANWPGGALDPETNILYIPSYYGPTTTLLTRPDASRSDLRFVPDIETWLAGPPGLHLLKPPYGKITAIDLDTGEHVWQTPHGRGPVDHPLLRHLDLPPMGESQRGYPLVTRSLLFMGQGDTPRGRLPTDDPERPNFRAFDKATGKELWSKHLPGAIAANPMTYEVSGRQFVVVALSDPSRLAALAVLPAERAAGTAARTEGETMKVEVEGATLHVEVSGPEGAPAVLLWNGAGCTTRMWDLVVPRLEDRLRVVRFDVRGTGRSTPAADPAQYSFEQYAADADAILDRLGIERAYVWSMAWGSRAALAYATLRPERIVRLALFDASIGAADTEAQARGHQEAMAKQAATGMKPFERPSGWNHHEHPDSVNQALGAARRFDLPAAAAKLEVETLVATGDHDPNLSSSRDLVAKAKRARLVVMENVGHGSVLQRPDLTTDLFLAFIANE